VAVTSINGKKWYIDYWYQNKRYREYIGPSKVMAKKALEARKGEIAQGRFNLEMIKLEILFNKLATKYLIHIQSYKKAPQSDENSIKNLLKAFKRKRLNQITPILIED
jgi:hypothetical protein